MHASWDALIGNGNPPGTFDFFTVTVHEVGHALGLDHSDHAIDIMYPYYTGERAWASGTDVTNIQSLYGYGGVWSNGGKGQFASIETVPEPSTAILFGLGVIILVL